MRPFPAIVPLGGDKDTSVEGGWVLAVPAGGVLLVAGIPGAGKSTLIQRVFPAGDGRPARADSGPVVLDSAQVRTVLARRLRHVPYVLYRPVVHTVHYWRIAAWTAGPRRDLVIHECGTRAWARRTVALLARMRGRPAYLVFLETPPATALAGQHQRGRVVPHRSFQRHERSADRVRTALRNGSLAAEGWTCARGITREEAARLTEIRFD